MNCSFMYIKNIALTKYKYKYIFKYYKKHHYQY